MWFGLWLNKDIWDQFPIVLWLEQKTHTELILCYTFALPQTVIALLYGKCVPILYSNIKITAPNREREQIVVVVVVFWNPVCPYRSNSIETTFAPKSDNSQIHHIKMVSPFGPMWMWCKNRFCLAESMCLVYKIEMFDVSKMQVEKLKALPLFACVIIPFWECFICTRFWWCDGTLAQLFSSRNPFIKFVGIGRTIHIQRYTNS